MQYIIDSANLAEIEKAFEYLPMTGVTTNPTIIAKEKRDFFQILRDIRAIIGEEACLHAQVIGRTADEMVADALRIRDAIPGNTFVKVPVTREGYKAMKELKKREILITATAIFTPMEALLAAECGADYAAPYVNRIDNIGGDGIEVVRQICELYELHQMSTFCLGASFKNARQVQEIALAGCPAATLPPDILWKVASHPLTEEGVDGFICDWESVYGKGVKVTDLPKSKGKTKASACK